MGFFREQRVDLVHGKIIELPILHNLEHRSNDNPTTDLLVVEVADTTLAYAQAGILDHWIVNLKRRQLEVRRQPGPGLSAKFNYGYASLNILQAADVVSPLAAPKAQIGVADLLP